MLVDELWLDDGDYHFQFMDQRRKWTSLRHPRNAFRGSPDSLHELVDSVESIGVVMGMRGGVWTQSSQEGEELVLHAATLCEATRAAVENDKGLRNKALQVTVSLGMPHSKRYSKRMPPDVADFLIMLGNKTNKMSTETGILEILKSTSECEIAFNRRKKTMNWTVSALGQARMEDKKFHVASSLYPKRWSTKNSFLNCAYFYKDSQLVTIQKGFLEGSTVWEATVSLVMATVPASHSLMRNHTFFFEKFSLVLRKLREHHSEYIQPVIALLLPRSELVGPLARCDLLPEGLPNPAICQLSEDMLDELTVEMSGSQIYANIKRESDQVDAAVAEAGVKEAKELQEQADVDVAADAASKTKANDKKKDKDKSKATKKSQLQLSRTMRISGEDMTQEFLDFLNGSMAYMLKLDKQQLPLVLAFQLISLHGALQGKTMMSRGGECRPVKSFATLSKSFKQHIYRKACLQPRQSDIDFAPGELVDDDDAADTGGGAVGHVAKVLLTMQAVSY